MTTHHGRTSLRFGSGLSNLGKTMLIIYAVIYTLELLCEYWLKIPIVAYLQLHPFQSQHFHVWQIVTHPFLHNPSQPFSFLINCLIFYFFAVPVETAFKQKGFLKLFYIAAFGGMICGLVMSSVSGFNAPFSGMMPSLLAMIVLFGFLNPDSTILLMFILPLKAKYLSYGTILITGLTFLAKANPNGAYHLGGIFFGWLYFKGATIMDPSFIKMKYLQWKLEKKKKKFKLIDGGSDDDNKPPTYH